MAETNNQTVEYDIDGEDVITEAIMTLINDYPKLQSGDEVSFCKLSENGGKSLFPVSGSVIRSTRHDILGGVEQECEYPFYVYYRAGSLSESRRKAVKEWLDDLGRWLEKQPIKVGEETYKLDTYPVLTGNRAFLSIQRTSPSSMVDVLSNNVEDWAIAISARYKNKF